MLAASISFAWKRFEALSASELYALLRLRNEVFVVEQGCAYLDIDGRDPEALHLAVALAGTPEVLAGCLRMFPPERNGACARVGRVATAMGARRHGLGRWMMTEALAEIGRSFGEATTEVDAQVQVEPFYRGLGFHRVSDDFDEDGIAHCRMRR